MGRHPVPHALQAYARAAGVLYLLVFALGFSIFAFPSFSQGPSAAVRAVVATQSQLRLVTAAELVLFSLDVPLALILYVLMRPVDRNIALLAAFFRLANAFFGSLSVLWRFAVISLLGSAAYAHAFSVKQRWALASVWLTLHVDAQDIGLVFFGVHCILLGILIYRSGYLPKFLGVLLPIAGVCYMLNSFADLISPAFAARVPSAIFLPGIVAEASLCLWLLIKGLDASGWIRRSPAAVG